MMLDFDLIMRWVHLLSVVAMAGGIYFWRFVVIPSLAAAPDDHRDQVVTELIRPWSRVVMATSGLLLISGLFNAVRIIMAYELKGTYHGLVMVKLVVALVVFFLSAKLAGRSDSAAEFRKQMSKWMTVNVVLVTLLIGVAGFMKTSPRVPKPVEPPDAMTRSVPGIDTETE